LAVASQFNLVAPKDVGNFLPTLTIVDWPKTKQRPLSPEIQDLISKLIKPATTRLPFDDILAHPWFTADLTKLTED
jgi:hypothetical protein